MNLIFNFEPDILINLSLFVKLEYFKNIFMLLIIILLNFIKNNL